MGRWRFSSSFSRQRDCSRSGWRIVLWNIRVRMDQAGATSWGRGCYRSCPGHWRYAHVSAIRVDGVNPGLLGMSAVVSEDTLRRGLKAIDEKAGSEWLKRHIGCTV